MRSSVSRVRVAGEHSSSCTCNARLVQMPGHRLRRPAPAAGQRPLAIRQARVLPARLRAAQQIHALHQAHTRHAPKSSCDCAGAATQADLLERHAMTQTGGCRARDHSAVIVGRDGGERASGGSLTCLSRTRRHPAGGRKLAGQIQSPRSRNSCKIMHFESRGVGRRDPIRVQFLVEPSALGRVEPRSDGRTGCRAHKLALRPSSARRANGAGHPVRCGWVRPDRAMTASSAPSARAPEAWADERVSSGTRRPDEEQTELEGTRSLVQTQRGTQQNPVSRVVVPAVAGSNPVAHLGAKRCKADLLAAPLRRREPCARPMGHQF
jgi:hypothetical protein